MAPHAALHSHVSAPPSRGAHLHDLLLLHPVPLCVIEVKLCAAAVITGNCQRVEKGISL